ncbi:hypothetical protein G6F31_018872 [Rhizopus arrhizus]|nr:hypothetical protein G6F31_018872 [Rhizopus arrhizus]
MSSPSATAARDPKAGYSARHELLVSRTGAGLPSYSFSSVSVDIKAFKGKGAFRSLSRQFANSVAQTRDAMDALALDTTRFEAGCYLRLVEERGRGALGRTRLRWCIRGQARYVRFEALRDVLAGLTPREAKVLRMRFGIDMNTDHTLEEVGKQFDVTRERIRQIEAKALRKLRHPSRSEQLRSFLDID